MESQDQEEYDEVHSPPESGANDDVISSTTTPVAVSSHPDEYDDLYRGAEDIARETVNEAVTEATKSQMLEERKPEEKEREREEEEKAKAAAQHSFSDAADDDSGSADYPSVSEYPALRFLGPKVLYVLYWRSPKLTGTIFAVLMAVSLALLCYTAIQVVCLVLKSVLVVSFGWRLLVALKQAIQKEPLTNPFEQYLKIDLGALVSERQVECFARQTRLVLIQEAKCLIHHLAVENYIDSLKFGFKLWLIYTFTGCCSTLSLFIVGLLLAFSLPKLYANNQAKVDEVAGKAMQQFYALLSKISSRLPFLKKKVQ